MEARGTRAGVRRRKKEAMNVKPVSLEGRTVRLEPLCLEHVPVLFEVGDPQIFSYVFSGPVNYTLHEFAEYAGGLLGRPDVSPFVTILRETGQPIGVTCYLEIRPAHRGLEI